MKNIVFTVVFVVGNFEDEVNFPSTVAEESGGWVVVKTGGDSKKAPMVVVVGIVEFDIAVTTGAIVNWEIEDWAVFAILDGKFEVFWDGIILDDGKDVEDVDVFLFCGLLVWKCVDQN